MRFEPHNAPLNGGHSTDRAKGSGALPAEAEELRERAAEAWREYYSAYYSDIPVDVISAAYHKWRDAQLEYETANSSAGGNEKDDRFRAGDSGSQAEKTT